MSAIDFAKTAFSREIGRNRRAFLQRAEKDDPQLHMIMRDTLAAKYRAGLPPSLGEILPIILSEVAEIDPARSSSISTSWYYLYCATTLIDDISDEDADLTVTTFLQAVALTHRATVKMLTACPDSRVRAQVSDMLNAALIGQTADVALHSTVTPQRLAADTEKNRLTQALAYLVASYSRSESGLADTVERLIPLFQSLDDLSDLQSDYGCRNWTGLILQILKPDQLASLPGGEKHLVWAILHNGNLSTILGKMGDELEAHLPAFRKSLRAHLLFSKLRADLEAARREIGTLEDEVAKRMIDLDGATVRFDRTIRTVSMSS